MDSVPQEKHIDIDGLRLHYRDWGGDGKGIVLLHGLASNCRIWDLVAPILSRTFKVVALDQRGHGDSDKPESGYGFDTVANDLDRFIHGIGMNNAAIVGHSWGANVGLEYAASLNRQPPGLCFVDGGITEISGHPNITKQEVRLEMTPPVFTGLMLTDLLEQIHNWPIGCPITPEIEAAIIANFTVAEDGTVTPKFSHKNHMEVVDAFWYHKPTRLFPMVSCPVLLMPARMPGEDSLISRLLRRTESVEIASQLLPKSKTVWLENSVHDVPLQRPEIVAEVISEHIDQGFFRYE